MGFYNSIIIKLEKITIVTFLLLSYVALLTCDLSSRTQAHTEALQGLINKSGCAAYFKL